ncbi:ABC transporter ATP-binding protein [Aliarcobacter butzleri]|uniref:ABC transporter ATP-binding protein n=1 Tax=Aliarcobacter butzleri TaxID=28197 RepID=UPI0024DEECBA|nr:ABC transporter ATP-binding protein [Aliarcobacter butzleri]MDK2083866.1 ABC transporter ATP-binding protein [Aliarcobacter butzleri]
MYKLVKELLVLLTKKQRKRLYSLQFLVIIMSFTEILGVASIGPFMALIGDISILESDNMLAKVYLLFNFSTKEDFIFAVGCFVLVLLTFSTIISTFTTWKLTMFGTEVGISLANRLYIYYLSQSWLFHTANSSAELTKQITTETNRVISGIIKPILQINAKIVFSFFMLIGMFIYDITVAVVGFLIFLLSYWLIYNVVKPRLYRFGKIVSSESSIRFKLINEGFGGVKDLILLNRQRNFEKQFIESGDKLAYSTGINQVLSNIPRYFMELIAFGSIISLILYLIKIHEGNVGYILSILSIYALAGFKLLPAFQSIYSSLSTIRSEISAFESIKDDLRLAMRNDLPLKDEKLEKKIHLQESISFNNISFKYPNKNEYVLRDFNCTIKANITVGFVGPSGSGKSTLIDMLMGLLLQLNGTIKIDDIVLERENIRAWQRNIGYVAQSIFLSEGTIAENIAFAIPYEKIEFDKINYALKLAHLTEFVSSLSDGINTKVGERGVQLSGGQRQRIGIARALYNDAEVLIFDEATSALDGITEKIIMDAIHDFSGKKTIIMIAHRLTTVEKCDQIFFIDNGKIIDQGTYQELLNRNSTFKAMALGDDKRN